MKVGSSNEYYRNQKSEKFDLLDISPFERIANKYKDIEITYYSTPDSEKFTIHFPEYPGQASNRRVIYEFIYQPLFPGDDNWRIHHQRDKYEKENFGKLQTTDDVNKVLKHFRQTASAARSVKKRIDSMEELNERKLTKAEVSKREDIIKDMKKNKRELTKRYGKDAEKVMYGRATNLAKKQLENMDPKSKLREMIKTALSSTNEEFTKKYDDDDALKGGQKDLPDGLQKAIIDKSKVKEELEDNPNYVPSRKAGDCIMNRHYDKVDWPGAIRYNDKVYHWFKQRDGITVYFDAQNPKDKLIFSSKEEMIDFIKEDKTPTPPPFNTVSKRRAQADMKQFMKGKRADGMGDYDAIILGIDKDGNQTQLKTLDDFNSKYVEYALANKDYKIPSIKEDLDLGHQDDEPHMLKANLYRIGKYAMELYQMMDKFEGQGEVDLPHWWQSKIIKSESMITSAKHYLDFELKEPEIDAMVDVASEEGAISESDSYVRVSKPKYIFDKNNPNFLFVNFKYDTGGGSSMALGKETMSGQIRRLSSAEAMKQATSLAKDLEKKYNIEDIDVYDKDNGIVQIFAVSDDFINMDKINEIDNNDPVLMRARAAKDKRKKSDSLRQDTKNIMSVTKNDKKLFALKKRRNQLMRDMEQEAEPEGGPIADRYGRELDKIDAEISKLRGKPLTYDQAINEAQKYDIEASLRSIRDFNRSESDDIEGLARNIIKNLGYKANDTNIDNTVTHLKMSTDDIDRLPVDPTVVRELYSILTEDEFSGPDPKSGSVIKGRGFDWSTYADELPSQEEVDRFFEETQNEMHYLASKPVMGQEKTFNNVEIKPWDKYDLSNWNALVRKKKEGRSPFGESKYSQLAEKIVKNLKKKSLSEDIYDNFLKNPKNPKGRAKKIIDKFIKKYGEDASQMAVDFFSKQNNLKPEEKYILKYITKNDIQISSKPGGPDFSALKEDVKEWPKEHPSRYNEYRFELDPTYKGKPGQALYKIIDIKSGKLHSLRTFMKIKDLMDYADDLIKPQGGRQSSQFEESLKKSK